MSINRRKFVQATAALVGGTVAGSATHPAEAQESKLTWRDPKYGEPLIDVDEWRDAPVRHRYVHGWFKGSDLLFSMYFPPKEQYQGRFFQPLQAVSGSENTAPMAMYQASGVGFAATGGGDVWQASAVRLRVRRQRRRVQDDRLRRNATRRVGWMPALRTWIAGGDPQLLHGASARDSRVAK